MTPELQAAIAVAVAVFGGASLVLPRLGAVWAIIGPLLAGGLQVLPAPPDETLPSEERDHNADFSALRRLEQRFESLENDAATNACSTLRREFFVRGVDRVIRT